MQQSRGSFSGRIGFVLAAAGSAVGLGNLWRFPYLAAKYGGGTFLLVYLILAVTFGFSLLIAEIAIGRRTGLSCLNAFGKVNRHFGFAGFIATIVPTIIMPYYCVIGGWIVKYLMVYITGEGAAAAQDGYFSGFISSPIPPLVYFIIFLTLSALIVSFGVEKGVEAVSRVLMPILVALSIIISVYICTRPGALGGIGYYLIPNMAHFSIKTVLAAVGQLFFSMSLAMGIMVTYGSYMPRSTDLEGAVVQIEIFDTLIAFLAGLMIIPAVYMFSGGDESAMSAGPGLMFITIPKVFNDMAMGRVIGAIFFLLVFCAALTSAISVMEAVVSSMCDKFHMPRLRACILFYVFCLALGALCTLGYGPLATFTLLGMQILDFCDFVTNSVLMPIGAIITSILIGWVVGTKYISDEVHQSSDFKREPVFCIMIKWFTPICLITILATSILSAFGLFSF